MLARKVSECTQRYRDTVASCSMVDTRHGRGALALFSSEGG